MAKVEAMVAALRRENNRYLSAIANVSAAVAELSDTVEALQRQLGACNVAASQALRMAGKGGSLVVELGCVGRFSIHGLDPDPELGKFNAGSRSGSTTLVVLLLLLLILILLLLVLLLPLLLLLLVVLVLLLLPLLVFVLLLLLLLLVLLFLLLLLL